MLKKLRATLVNGLIWAATWTGWNVLLVTAVYMLGPSRSPSLAVVLPMAATSAAVRGFVGGALFSAVLGVLHRNRLLEELSPPRLAAWGAFGGCLVPAGQLMAGAALGLQLTVGLVGSVLAASAVPGIATAYGTIKLAQAAGELPEIDEPDAIAAPERA